jgi:hypothetical protein
MARRRAGWLTWRPPDDRGGVAVVFAILLGSGVLLGMLALVVDVGRIYVERNEVQNGADSAALGVAKACAELTSECTVDGVWSVAEDYANRNASDERSRVEEVCGYLPGVLPECGTRPDNLTACLGEPPTSYYAEVWVSTQMSDGDTVLPFAVAQTFASGERGTTVAACARAAWEPEGLSILAVTITACQFNDATNNGTQFADPSSPRLSDEFVAQFWTGSGGSCSGVAPDGWQEPNGAGFLNTADPSCEVLVAVDIVAGSFFGFEPFDIAPLSCVGRIADARAGQEEIYLPIYDGRRGGTSNPQFHIVAVAPFVVTGFQLAAPASANPPYNAEDYRDPSTLTGRHPCDIVRYRCLTGIFVGEPIPLSELSLNNVRITLIG